MHNYKLLLNSRPPPSSSALNSSKTSSASSSIDVTLVHDKEDEPATKKRIVYNFQTAWLKEFEWLEWDSEKELMPCQYCKAFPTHASSSLVNGCNNFKHETLTKHSKSKSHVYCRDCYLTRSGKSKAVTQHEPLLEVLARQETAQGAELQRALEIKFNVAYTIAKEEDNRRQQKTTEDLIRISMEGPELKAFDPTPAVVKWFSSGQRSRRPNFAYRRWPDGFSC